MYKISRDNNNGNNLIAATASTSESQKEPLQSPNEPSLLFLEEFIERDSLAVLSHQVRLGEVFTVTTHIDELQTVQFVRIIIIIKIVILKMLIISFER